MGRGTVGDQQSVLLTNFLGTLGKLGGLGVLLHFLAQVCALWKATTGAIPVSALVRIMEDRGKETASLLPS